jgi:hypothetical protein
MDEEWGDPEPDNGGLNDVVWVARLRARFLPAWLASGLGAKERAIAQAQAEDLYPALEPA